ncbi:MAG: ATP-binding protein [Roseburia sp.]|nr:ATP-binding protein [Roseburia sp.]MCM1098879.1 ATP-binding protein [Ruminococcus flavefaciens]
MLKRKMEAQLRVWKEDNNRMPLIIKGCRQCGKTYIVQKFARENYRNVVYLNFFQNPDYTSIFAGSLEVDHIIIMISALMGSEVKFEPYRTILILDEIQECPEARTALKFFKMDGRFDVIGTGSLLGVRGYKEKPVSIPVGYETVLEMYPLDFEEFLWANGISEDVIQILRSCMSAEKPVPDALHKKLHQLLLNYIVVGGMPAVVESFVRTKEINTVLRLQRDIVSSYEDDMLKYADEKDKPLIKECFQSIPKQLAKENKKFQYSVVKKGSTASRFLGSLQWIEDAGIIRRCYNLSITELPLDGNAIEDVFKVYLCDIGLLVSMLEEGTQFDILSGNLLGYKGAIFENYLADVFVKMNRKLYYFHKDSGLEIDFVTRYKGECVPVEVKAVTGNAKSMRTVLKHPEKYHIYHAIKLGAYNVGREDSILTLPLYMAFLLTEY